MRVSLFDSHCHLTSERFDGDRLEVIRRARAAGVTRIVSIASTPDDAGDALALVQGEPGLWTTAGVHPHEAESARDGWRGRVSELLGRDDVVAVGECGLDYHYDHSPRAVQRRVFTGQVELARETGLPLVVHSRSADDDMAAVLRDLSGDPEADRVRGVLHCFTGSDGLLEAALDAGFHVSFTGLVTFGSFDAEHQMARVPRGRIMVETDAPYLAPVPYRGKRNEPARVREVAEAVARARGESFEALARHTTEAACRFYGVDA